MFQKYPESVRFIVLDEFRERLNYFGVSEFNR